MVQEGQGILYFRRCIGDIIPRGITNGELCLGICKPMQRIIMVFLCLLEHISGKLHDMSGRF